MVDFDVVGASGTWSKALGTGEEEWEATDAAAFDFPTGFDASILANQSQFAGAPRPRYHPEDRDDDAEEANIRRREMDFDEY